jgi:His-Xaa-Ser system radical SAM maturase HxsC
MCSQPPLKKDDIDAFFIKNLSLIENAPLDLPSIGVTGGEPTLLGSKLFELINHIKKHLPETMIHLLTNGRAFSDIHYVNSLYETGTENILLGIPLHSDYSGDHDAISQISGSYNETMKGLYNLARFGFIIELRIVINKMNYKRLPHLSKFIYKNLPFVTYISFMGQENIGYSIKNHNEIWIDPIHYQDELEEAVIDLATWGMNVSVFNLPHCLLKESLYEFSCKSISDWKVCYVDCCNQCKAQNDCCGLFSTSKIQSGYIKPIN